VDVERVIAALAPRTVLRRAPVEITDLAYDAAAVSPGALFFCVRGSRADGHDFAPAAVERGAVALVVERELELAVPQLVVDDARGAMASAAAPFFGHPSRDLEVAGVTGTSGKTTTAYLLHAILDAAGRRPALLGSIERRVGGELLPVSLNTPEAIDLQRLFRRMLDAGDRSCAMEATSEASAQGRLEGTRFAVLVFTNLSQDHLNFHGTMERYFEAKRRLFAQTDRAVVNVDDEWGRRLAGELPDAIAFGLGDARDALAGVELRLRGEFNVANAVAAATAARALGVDDEAIAAGIASVAGVPGRFEEVDEGQPFTVLVDYSHKPAALETVLREARGLADGRVLCVFGCGGDRDREKRPLMGRIAAELADVTIVTSDNPRSEDPLAIIEEIVAGAGGAAEVEPDRRRAIERAVGLAAPGDVVVIAGKGHETGQEIAGRKLPFDDREVAREALRATRAPA
jgi:UDP-N-acetylmuramoyl-L-alanyl-D-glutamate--2,6-diaminopimelate ligase